MVFNPSYANDYWNDWLDGDWELDEAYNDVALRSFGLEEYLGFGTTVPAFGFEKIGITGTLSFISQVNADIQRLMSDSNGTIDPLSPGYALMNQINQGTTYIKNTMFCVVIRCGKNNIQMFNARVSTTHEGIERAYAASVVSITSAQSVLPGNEVQALPRHLVLGHELIHAWRGQLGLSLYKNGYEKVLYKCAEELEVVFGNAWSCLTEGVSSGAALITANKISSVPLITENNLRQYFELPLRTSYDGLNFNNFLRFVDQTLKNHSKDIVSYTKEKTLTYATAIATSLVVVAQAHVTSRRGGH